jgi:hypothetical protein
MNRTTLLATTALLWLVAAGTVGAQGQRPATWGASDGPTITSPHCTDLPPLYQQNVGDSGIAIVSQNFESSFDQYDAEAADDFKVTAATWFIREVDVPGTYFDGAGLARDETVTFYKSAAGLPGEAIARFTIQGADPHFGSFCIPIRNGLLLKKGHYWVSVVANMDFLTAGEWGWENQSTRVFSPSVWRNPGGGFGVCQTWTRENVCIPNGQRDHLFTLR